MRVLISPGHGKGPALGRFDGLDEAAGRVTGQENTRSVGLLDQRQPPSIVAQAGVLAGEFQNVHAQTCGHGLRLAKDETDLAGMPAAMTAAQTLKRLRENTRRH